MLLLRPCPLHMLALDLHAPKLSGHHSSGREIECLFNRKMGPCRARPDVRDGSKLRNTHHEVASMALGSFRRGRSFWFAENPTTTFAQTSSLLPHAGGNTLHIRNF